MLIHWSSRFFTTSEKINDQTLSNRADVCWWIGTLWICCVPVFRIKREVTHRLQHKGL